MSQEQVSSHEANPLSSFNILRTINAGRNPIYHAFDTKSHSDVVLKVFPFNSLLRKGYIKERQNLQNLNHPHIIKLTESHDHATLNYNGFEEEVSFLALNYSSNGDLLDVISKHGQISEALTRTLFHQLIDAVSYLHHRNIAHMDIKVENLLLDENLDLKLIDFDLSQPADSVTIQSNGTPGYRAPEFKTGTSHDLTAIDVYSLGVVLFILITGYPPYSETTRGYDFHYDAYYRLFRSNPSKFWDVHAKHKSNPEFYSEDFKNLITQMLAENPAERPKIQDILNSTWYNGKTYDSDEYKKMMNAYLGK